MNKYAIIYRHKGNDGVFRQCVYAETKEHAVLVFNSTPSVIRFLNGHGRALMSVTLLEAAA